MLSLITAALACRGGGEDTTLVFTPDQLPAGQAGAPYDVTITVTKNVTPVGDFALSDGSLPDGLSFEYKQNESSVRIYGVPQESGTFDLAFSVWCYGTNHAGQTGTKTYKLVINP